MFRQLKYTGMIFLLFCSTCFAAKALITPVGYWKQYSDKTNKLQSVLKISRFKDTYVGKVVKAYSTADGGPPQTHCTKCPAPFTNKKIIGMTLMWGFRYDAFHDEYVGGNILDPDSGHIYRCKMLLANHGKQLNVRGYIGIPLLGRTQHWIRTNKA